MAKKKEDNTKPQESGTVTVSREEFKQTRDNFLSSFVVLQEAIRDLTSTYIRHTNTVLGNDASSFESALKDLGEAASSAVAAGRSVSPAKSEADKKKERKKRVHDTNAPKRPLTPFFLYMQTARPIIANDLGADAAKGAVSEEGTRRWGIMAKPDRDSWTNAYRDNLKLYNARVHSYKNGNTDAKNMTDDEARIYFDDHLAGAGDHAADAQLVNEAEAVADSPEGEVDADMEVEAEAEPEAESEEEEPAPVVVRTPTPPPKTPKVKASRKKATPKTEAPVVEPVPAPTVAAQAAEPEKPVEKKRKRKTKAELDKEKAEKAEKEAAEDAPVDSIEREELLVQTPAVTKSSSKPKKKKAKASEA